MNSEHRGRSRRSMQAGDPTRPVVRCAIYTRKSTDENVDSDFNSLDAQREAGEMYVRSQASEGWVVLPALAGNSHARANHARATTPALLRGILRCGHCDAGMTTTFTRKNGRTYRYYLCGHAAKHGRDTCPLCVVPAGDIETAVLDQVRQTVRLPEVRTQALAIIRGHEEDDRKRLAAEKEGLEAELGTLNSTASRMLHGPQAQASADFVVSELARIDGQAGQIREGLAAVNVELEGLEARPTTDASLAAELTVFDRIWAELVPAEQERLVHLVVERVTVHQDGLDLALRADGVAGVVRELRGAREGGGSSGFAAGKEVARA